MGWWPYKGRVDARDREICQSLRMHSALFRFAWEHMHISMRGTLHIWKQASIRQRSTFNLLAFIIVCDQPSIGLFHVCYHSSFSDLLWLFVFAHVCASTCPSVRLSIFVSLTLCDLMCRTLSANVCMHVLKCKCALRQRSCLLSLSVLWFHVSWYLVPLVPAWLPGWLPGWLPVWLPRWPPGRLPVAVSQGPKEKKKKLQNHCFLKMLWCF